MPKAKDAHFAMYQNYRRAYREKHSTDWPGTDDQLEAIIENCQGMSSSAETDECVLEDMSKPASI